MNKRGAAAEAEGIPLTADQHTAILQGAGQTLQAARKRRGRKGMSQRDTAARLGVTKNVLSDVERGEHYPRMENLLNMAWYHGLTMGDIFHVYENFLLSDTTYQQILALLPGTPEQGLRAILYFLQVIRAGGIPLSVPISHA
jgi:transcriptional regulator with XRE-family HTH domain